MTASPIQRRAGVTALTFAVIILAAAALRVALADYSLWFDEYASLLFADQPVSRLWSDWMVREANPPLFYTMLKGWEAVAGQSTMAVRLLPIAGGAVQMLLAAIIARRLYGPRAAVAALVIVGLSAQAIGYSHLLRGYIFASDTVLLALLGLLIWLDGGPRRLWGLALYAIASAAGFYFHTTMAIWPAVATVSIAAVYWRELAAERFRMLRELALASLVIAALGAWWAWLTWLQFGQGNRNIAWIPPLSNGELRHTFSRTVLFAIDRGPQDIAVRWTARLMLAGSLLLLWRDRHARLLGAMLLASVLAFLAASQVQPVVLERTLYWLTIFPLLLIAGGIARLRPAAAGWAALAVLGALLAVNTAQHAGKFELQPWDRGFDRVAAVPGSVLLVENLVVATVAAKACEVHFTATRCPIPIVATGTKTLSDTWAAGLRPIKVVSAADLPAALAGASAVFAARHGAYDPMANLGLLDERGRLARIDPLIEGPYSPGIFDALSQRLSAGVSAR